QLVVKDRGLYRVDYTDVFSMRAGEIPTSSLRLSRQGTSVAFHVEPDPTRFGPNSSLYFLTEGASLNPYGDAEYELLPGALGLQMSEEQTTPAASTVLEEQATLTREENHYYQAGLLDAPDLWLWDLLVSPVSKSYAFAADHVSSGSAGHVTVWLQGASDFDGVTDHHVRVRVNGVMVGDATWDGRLPNTIDADVPAGVIHEGANTLDLENVGDTGASYSLVFLDKFAVRHPRGLVARAGTLEGSFATSGQASVDGLEATGVLIDTTDAPRWIVGLSPTVSGASFAV